MPLAFRNHSWNKIDLAHEVKYIFKTHTFINMFCFCTIDMFGLPAGSEKGSNERALWAKNVDA